MSSIFEYLGGIFSSILLNDIVAARVLLIESRQVVDLSFDEDPEIVWPLRVIKGVVDSKLLLGDSLDLRHLRYKSINLYIIT